MDDNHLRRQALARDPTITMPSRQQGKTAYMTGPNGEPLHPKDPQFQPGAKVARVLHGYDRDGDPIYDHYFIGGSK